MFQDVSILSFLPQMDGPAADAIMAAEVAP